MAPGRHNAADGSWDIRSRPTTALQPPIDLQDTAAVQRLADIAVQTLSALPRAQRSPGMLLPLMLPLELAIRAKDALGPPVMRHSVVQLPSSRDQGGLQPPRQLHYEQLEEVCTCMSHPALMCPAHRRNTTRSRGLGQRHLSYSDIGIPPNPRACK
jgi:hypothetical protein